MSTHTGKIGRLPERIQDELNLRLREGENRASLLQWLNRLPEVQAVLARDFGGRKIQSRNLAAWKAGGYQEWQIEADLFMRAIDQTIARSQAKATPIDSGIE